MIRKLLIALCLILSLVMTILIAVSYRKELVCYERPSPGLKRFPKECGYVDTSHEIVVVRRGRLECERESWAILTSPSWPNDKSLDFVVGKSYRFISWGFRSLGVVYLLEKRGIAIRLWVLLPTVLLYPTVVLICGPYRQYRRRKRGYCVHCGYDLTGNVSGVCPECGVRRENRQGVVDERATR